MLKLLRLTVAVSALFTFLPEIALSNPGSETTPNPAVSNANESSVCYIQTEDGKTLNLDSLCWKGQPTPKTSSVRPSRQCYFVDSDGRPCETASSDNQGSDRNK